MEKEPITTQGPKKLQEELEDLKSKIAGLTSLGLFEISPFSSATPPICGPGGRFVVPPGVQDTMERITDSLLTNLKGSLIIDLAGLKFFSTPPRALLAAGGEAGGLSPGPFFSFLNNNL